MNAADIEMLFAWNEWANGRLLDAAAALDREEATRDLGASHRSVHGTLFHLVFSEWDWLAFWNGKTWTEIVREEPTEAEVPDIEALQTRWRSIAAQQRRFIRSLDDGMLQVSTASEALPLAQLMQHVINHSSYHRGQVVTLLRQLGKAPPATDYLVFARERRVRAQT